VGRWHRVARGRRRRLRRLRRRHEGLGALQPAGLHTRQRRDLVAAPVQRARELLLLGRAISGTEAVEWGLGHRAVAAADVDRVAEALAVQLASGPTVSLGLTKWLLHTSAEHTLDAHLRDEAFAMELSSRSEDFREGLAAFVEKRDPEFGGR